MSPALPSPHIQEPPSGYIHPQWRAPRFASARWSAQASPSDSKHSRCQVVKAPGVQSGTGSLRLARSPSESQR